MAKGPTLTVTLLTDDKMTKGLAGATTSVEGFGKRISGFAVGAGAAITTLAINAIPQLLSLGGQMLSLGQQAELYATKSATVFGGNSGDIAEWADSVNESFGLSEASVVGLAASMGDLLVPMGFTRDEAARMTQETVGVAGALSAWSGGAYDTAAVTDILTKAMLGEREQLKALGISINQAEVDQRAMEIAQKDGRDAITEQDKALATQQLIFEKSADAQAAWNDGSMDAIKNQNEMSAAIEDAKTAIGTALLPAMQAATEWMTSSFIPGVKDLVATFKERWPEIKAAIEPTLTWLVETVQSVVEAVQAFWEQFGDRILTNAKITWEYVRKAIESSLMIIKGVIDLITGIISGDWSKAWDGIKSIVQGVWDGIKALIELALQAIGLLLDIAWENIKGAVGAAWDGIKTIISDAVGAVVEFIVGIPGRITDVVSTMFDGIGDNMGKAKTGVGEKVGEIVGFVTGIPGRIFEAASSMFDVVKDQATATKDWIGEKVGEIVGFVTGIPGKIASGIGDGFNALWTNFKKVINKIIRGINSIKLPSVTIGGWDIPGPGPNIPSFTTPTIDPFPHITELATGGVVTKPTLALIGEAGPEAVIPLGRGASGAAAPMSPAEMSRAVSDGMVAGWKRVQQMGRVR